MDVTTFLDRHHADLTPLERAMVLSAADDAKADGQDSRQKAERQAAAEERVERLTLANRQGHDPIGELRRARELCSAADDEVRDLADKLAKATVRRDRRQERIQSLSRQLDEITAAVSRVPATGIEGAASRAQEALREANAERRVEHMLSRAAATPRPAPPAERSGPVAAAGRMITRVCGGGLTGNHAPEWLSR